MKRIAFILIASLMAFCACEKDPVYEPFDDADYRGVVTVEYQGVNYDNNNISVEVDVDDATGTLTIDLYQIKFVPQMPVTVDVTIPGVKYSEAEGVLTFSGDNIIPLSGVVPVERYLVTGLSGTIKDRQCSFSLNFGAFPTSFVGTEVDD